MLSSSTELHITPHLFNVVDVGHLILQHNAVAVIGHRHELGSENVGLELSQRVIRLSLHLDKEKGKDNDRDQIDVEVRR